MPSYLNLNGERLPIGTSDLNGDTDEEEEFGPSGPSQWSALALQAALGIGALGSALALWLTLEPALALEAPLGLALEAALALRLALNRP